VTLPTFQLRARVFERTAPPNLFRSPILTDDYAPIETLLEGVRQ
jgi:hypothetical protein